MTLASRSFLLPVLIGLAAFFAAAGTLRAAGPTPRPIVARVKPAASEAPAASESSARAKAPPAASDAIPRTQQPPAESETLPMGPPSVELWIEDRGEKTAPRLLADAEPTRLMPAVTSAANPTPRALPPKRVAVKPSPEIAPSSPLPAPAAAPMTLQPSPPAPTMVAAPQPARQAEPNPTPKKLPHVRIGPPPAIAQSAPPAPHAPRTVPAERDTVEATPAPPASDPVAARVQQYLPGPSRWLQPPPPVAEEPSAAAPSAPLAREVALPTIPAPPSAFVPVEPDDLAGGDHVAVAGFSSDGQALPTPKPTPNRHSMLRLVTRTPQDSSPSDHTPTEPTPIEPQPAAAAPRIALRQPAVPPPPPAPPDGGGPDKDPTGFNRAPSREDLKRWFKTFDVVGANIQRERGELPFDASRRLFNDAPPGQVARLDWPLLEYQWAAPEMWHQPLYFDDEPLERYGQTISPQYQPYLSGLRFYMTLPVMPFKLWADRPYSYISTLGYFRPGAQNPSILQRPEWPPGESWVRFRGGWTTWSRDAWPGPGPTPGYPPWDNAPQGN